MTYRVILDQEQQLRAQETDPNTPKTSILIADDHVFLAESVAAALEAPSRGYKTKIAATFEQARAALDQGDTFDLVMLDLKMPGMLGLKSIRDIIALASPGQVVLLSGNADLALVRAAVDCGARGLIPKTLSLKSLISVVDLVLSGQIFIPAEDMGEVKTISGAGQFQLSEREISILRLASEGRINKEIGSAIGATEVGVKMHMRSICRKLNARNRAHAVTISKERDLI